MVRSDIVAINKELRKLLPEDSFVLDNPSFDDSIVGVEMNSDRIIYSYDKMIVEYAKDNNCDELEAMDWINYNTIRALPYIGDKAPMIMFEVLQ
jgi:hypothetical protein